MPKRKRDKLEQNRIQNLRRKLAKLQDLLGVAESDDNSSRSSDSSLSSSAASFQTQEVNEETSSQEVTFAPELISALGPDPSTPTKAPTLLSPLLVSRWQSYISQGLSKEVREDLTVKYTIPENCNFLHPPKLNPEVQSVLHSLDVKKDAVLCTMQEKMGRGLTALGLGIQALGALQSPANLSDSTAPIVTQLSDTAKFFTEVFYLLTNHRKHQIYPKLATSVQKVADDAPPDSLLFGSDLSERVKKAQELQRRSSEYKRPLPHTSVRHSQPGTSSKAATSGSTKRFLYGRSTYKEREKYRARQPLQRSNKNLHSHRSSPHPSRPRH